MTDPAAPVGERLAVALVRGLHGLRGAVRVEVLTDRPDTRFVPGAALFREGTTALLTIASAEAVADGPGWRLRFEEIVDRAAAEALRGAYLETTTRPDADLGRGEVYWHEVMGVTVQGVDGAVLGTVQDIYRVGENEVYVVGGGAYRTFDVPAVRAFIRIFAPRRGEIVVDGAALDLQPVVSPAGAEPRPRAPRRGTRRPRALTEATTATKATDAEAGPSDEAQPTAERGAGDHSDPPPG